MITILGYAGPLPVDAPVTRVGGVPLVPDDFDWPVCSECEEPMQFLLQLDLDDLDDPEGAGGGRAGAGGRGLLSVFMCQNDPGGCDEWDPTSGGNRALLFPREGLAPAEVPEDGETLRDESHGVTYRQTGAATYHEARLEAPVLGRLGGAPEWIQADDTPFCASCEERMDFVAQFEEGPHDRTSMNFGGGGNGYAFTCEPCRRAAFCWQR